MRTTIIRTVSQIVALTAPAALIAAAAAPAVAAPSGQTSGAGSAASVKPENDTRKYCVEYKHSGSRFIRKTCKSREEWIKETGVDPATK